MLQSSQKAFALLSESAPVLGLPDDDDDVAAFASALRSLPEQICSLMHYILASLSNTDFVVPLVLGLTLQHVLCVRTEWENDIQSFRLWPDNSSVATGGCDVTFRVESPQNSVLHV